MEIDDLIVIGKLGFSDVIKEWIPVKLNPDFQKYLEKLEHLHLIFTDHRVRYVSISKVKFIRNKWYLKIKEKEVYLEAANLGFINIAVDFESCKQVEDEDYYDPIGLQIIYNKEKLGIVEDWFSNGAHDIFVLKDSNGKEIMIPDVNEYIEEIDLEHSEIHVKNIQALLEI